MAAIAARLLLHLLLLLLLLLLFGELLLLQLLRRLVGELLLLYLHLLLLLLLLPLLLLLQVVLLLFGELLLLLLPLLHLVLLLHLCELLLLWLLLPLLVLLPVFWDLLLLLQLLLLLVLLLGPATAAAVSTSCWHKLLSLLCHCLYRLQHGLLRNAHWNDCRGEQLLMQLLLVHNLLQLLSLRRCLPLGAVWLQLRVRGDQEHGPCPCPLLLRPRLVESKLAPCEWLLLLRKELLHHLPLPSAAAADSLRWCKGNHLHCRRRVSEHQLLLLWITLPPLSPDPVFVSQPSV